MLSLTTKSIPDVAHTASGYAIRADCPATRDSLLEPENAKRILAMCGGDKIERPEKWYRYAVKEVPCYVIDITTN